MHRKTDPRLVKKLALFGAIACGVLIVVFVIVNIFSSEPNTATPDETDTSIATVKTTASTESSTAASKATEASEPTVKKPKAKKRFKKYKSKTKKSHASSTMSATTKSTVSTYKIHPKPTTRVTQKSKSKPIVKDKIYDGELLD